MESALEKAKTARLHILEKMNAVISGPKELSDNTPAMKKITVHQDKIKEIIGDREFVGTSWFKYLKDNNIGVLITFKDNMYVTRYKKKVKVS